MFILGVIANRMRIQNIEFVGGYTEAYDGTTSDKTISLTSLTGGLDTQPSEGDIVVILYGVGGVNSTYGIVNLPTGYTSVITQQVNDAYTSISRVAYKFMGSTPDTSITIPSGTGNTNFGGSISILVFRNVNTTTVLDVAALYTITNNVSRPNPPAITPITEGAVILAGGCVGHNNSITHTFSSGDLTNFISSDGYDNYDCITGIGYKLWEGGVFDPTQFSCTLGDSSSESAIGYTIALRPK